MTHPGKCWVKHSAGRFPQTPDTGQDTCRVPAYPWHWPGYLQDTCIPLTLLRIAAGYLHTPDTGQDTCRVPADLWHWSGYPQGTNIPLTLVRIPAGYLHTPDTGQGTCITLTLVRIPARYLDTLTLVREPAGTCIPRHWSGYVQGTCIPWHWSGYQQGTCIPLTLARIWKSKDNLRHNLQWNLDDPSCRELPKKVWVMKSLSYDLCSPFALAMWPP